MSLDTSQATGEGLLAGLKEKLSGLWAQWSSSTESAHVYTKLMQDLQTNGSSAGAAGKSSTGWRRALFDLISKVRQVIWWSGVVLPCTVSRCSHDCCSSSTGVTNLFDRSDTHHDAVAVVQVPDCCCQHMLGVCRGMQTS